MNVHASQGASFIQVPIDNIRRDDGQTRRDFDPEKLEELAASVKEVGILEPLELQPDPQTAGHFVIVFGERRWRAAKLAGLATVPAIVHDEARQLRRRQLYENVVRVDLNVVELAANVAAVMAEEKIETKALAEQLRWPLRRLQRLLEIHAAPDAVKTAIVKGVHLEGGRRTLSLRHALDAVRAYRHYAREDDSESKEKAAARLEHLVARVLNEDWSAQKLQEYVGALGRSPKRDPLDRVAKYARSQVRPADTPSDVETTPTPPLSGSRPGTKPLPLFEAKVDRFTVFVKRARENQDVLARAALADALRALVNEFAP